MHQSVQASLADLGLDDVELNRSQSKSKKQNEIAEIPLQENLPAEEFVKKDDPVPYAELKFF